MAMKISGITGKNIEDLKDIRETKKKEETPKAGIIRPEEKPVNQAEVVEVSSQKLIESAIQKISSLPEVREEKVSQIREKIQSGTYSISNREIARAMILNLLNEIT